MSNKTETGMQKLNSFFQNIELRLRPETEIEPILDETRADELTLKSVDERVKKQPIHYLGE